MNQNERFINLKFAPNFMDSTAIRFLHASDFWLDFPVEGILELDDSALEERLRLASRRAVERVFDVALLEEVDFIVLSGNLCHLSQTGPGTALFLIEQFERCATQRIPIYWAGGPHDSPEDWHSVFTLPPNVHRFSSETVQEFFWERDNIPAVRLVGRSRNSHDAIIKTNFFNPDPAGLFTIAVTNGVIDTTATTTQKIQNIQHIQDIPFWALGGNRARKLIRHAPRRTNSNSAKNSSTNVSKNVSKNTESIDHGSLVHYAGSPWAHCPSATGDYGVTLVEVDADAPPKLTFISTSPLCWIHDRIVIKEEQNTAAITQEIFSLMEKHAETAKAKDADIFVSFRLQSASEKILARLRNESLADDLLQQTRLAFGAHKPLCMPLPFVIDVPESLPASLYEQQTILGDYLRLVRHYQAHLEHPLDVSPFLPPEFLRQTVGKRLLLATPAQEENDDENSGKIDASATSDEETIIQTLAQKKRQAILLREAALIGSEMLGYKKVREKVTENKVNA